MCRRCLYKQDEKKNQAVNRTRIEQGSPKSVIMCMSKGRFKQTTGSGWRMGCANTHAPLSKYIRTVGRRERQNLYHTVHSLSATRSSTMNPRPTWHSAVGLYNRVYYPPSVPSLVVTEHSGCVHRARALVFAIQGGGEFCLVD